MTQQCDRTAESDSGIYVHNNDDFDPRYVNQSVFPTKNFKWENAVLFQEFEIIQHKPNDKRDVGIFHEWRQVIVKGEGVTNESRLWPVLAVVAKQTEAHRSSPWIAMVDRSTLEEALYTIGEAVDHLRNDIYFKTHKSPHIVT